MKTTDEKNNQTANNETKNAPFFAQSTKGKALVIKTSIRAGSAGAEEQVK
jgi:hypothetical protein